MLPITLIMLLIDAMPKFLLFYQLECLHHNYSIQYRKLVISLIGAMPPDSVVTCLSESWRLAKKQCYLQKEKPCISVCLYIFYAQKQKMMYIFLSQADTLAGCFEVSKCYSTEKEQIFQNIVFFEMDLVFLKVTPPPGLAETFLWHMGS